MKARIVWLILCGIWGSTWLFIKLGLADLPPFTFAGIRFRPRLTDSGSLILIRARALAAHPKRMDLDCRRRLAAIHSELRPGFLGRATYLLGSGCRPAIDLSAFGLVIAHFYLPQERMTTVEGRRRAAGDFRRRGDLFRSIDYCRFDGAAGQHRARAERCSSVPMEMFW